MTTLHDLYRNAWQEISFGFNDMLGRHEPDETIVSVLDAVIDKWGALIDHKLKQHHRPPSGKAHLRSLTSNEERRRSTASSPTTSTQRGPMTRRGGITTASRRVDERQRSRGDRLGHVPAVHARRDMDGDALMSKADKPADDEFTEVFQAAMKDLVKWFPFAAIFKSKDDESVRAIIFATEQSIIDAFIEATHD